MSDPMGANSVAENETDKINALYEMAGFTEDPRDKDLIVEAKWLLECQFMVIVAACEKYNDTVSNWERYVNQVVVPRVAGVLQQKLKMDKAAAGTLIQSAVNSLQSKLEADKISITKVQENIQLLGGAI